MRCAARVLLAILVFSGPVARAEEPSATFESLAAANQLAMREQSGEFSGPGWQHILERVQSAGHTLFGEDHFTCEIPLLATAIGAAGDFDNFYIEVDPFSTAMIEQSFREFTPEERAEFNDANADFFSFYALAEEYAMLEQMMAQGSRLLGSDQIVMYADRFVLREWVNRTGNDRAREIYQRIIEASAQRYDAFVESQGSPASMYFLTPEFERDLDALLALDLAEDEAALVGYLKTSVNIYKDRSHRDRVQLIKHHVMNDIEKWRGKRNLFKYGANHLTRGESFLTVHDIGVLVANVAEADYEQTFHIMVLGESGRQASPFRGFPAQEVNQNGFYLKHLQPFFGLTTTADWQVFDLVPLRRAMLRGEIEVDVLNLRRTLMGYDSLVLIPEVTPATFPAAN